MAGNVSTSTKAKQRRKAIATACMAVVTLVALKLHLGLDADTIVILSGILTTYVVHRIPNEPVDPPVPPRLTRSTHLRNVAPTSRNE